MFRKIMVSQFLGMTQIKIGKTRWAFLKAAPRLMALFIVGGLLYLFDVLTDTGAIIYFCCFVWLFAFIWIYGDLRPLKYSEMNDIEKGIYDKD